MHAHFNCLITQKITIMRYFLFILIAFSATFASAQDTLSTPKVDTTEITLNRSKILIIKREKNQDNGDDTDTDTDAKTPKKIRNTSAMWNGFQVGTSTILADNTLPTFLELDGTKNRSFAFNPFSRRWDLGTPYVGISTGLGFEFNRYALNRNVRLQYDSDHVWATPDSINDFTKNQFKTIHLTAPIFFELNTRKKADEGFRLAFGLEAGYLLSARTKVKYKVDGKKQVDKTKGNFNLSPFKISPMVLIGYRGISFYAKASATPMFLDKKGPKDLYSASAGLFFSFN